MKIFVINLEKSVDRKAFMSNQLLDLNLEHEFWPAVDGRSLTAVQIANLCDAGRLKEWPELFTPGAIGCALSHYQVYKEIVRMKIPYALILEDDVSLSRDFAHLIQAIDSALASGELNDDEILSLYFQQDHIVEFLSESQIRLTSPYTANYPARVGHMNTASAYVISHSVANRLSDFILPIKFTSDCWGDFSNAGLLLGMRCVLPLPARSGYFKSDIGYELNSFFKNLVRQLEGLNMFPVKQIMERRRRKRAISMNRYSVIKKDGGLK